MNQISWSNYHRLARSLISTLIKWSRAI